VAFIPREEFMDILEERPAAWFNVLRLLSSEVNGVYDEMRALSASHRRHCDRRHYRV